MEVGLSCGAERCGVWDSIIYRRQSAQSANSASTAALRYSCVAQLVSVLFHGGTPGGWCEQACMPRPLALLCIAPEAGAESRFAKVRARDGPGCAPPRLSEYIIRDELVIPWRCLWSGAYSRSTERKPGRKT